MAPAATAVIRQEGPWWLGWVEELLASLRHVPGVDLEFNRLEALEAAGPGDEGHALPL
jgi:hypothetical protein